MIPAIAAYVVGSSALWAANNVIGLGPYFSNLVDPKITFPRVPAAGSDFSTYLNNGYDFRFRVSAPSNTDIRAIDDFFESYGYNVSRFQLPILNVRPNFTFIKTRDAVVYSSVRQAAEQYAAMLNGGTKFWIGEIGE